MCKHFSNKSFRVYKRGDDVQLTEHFHISEFECKCGKCDVTRVSIAHVNALQNLRYFLDMPIYITSGFRCKNHNETVGGAPRSRHMVGDATDIICPIYRPIELAAYCENFGGLGIYNSFIHIDSRPGKARWNLTSA